MIAPPRAFAPAARFPDAIVRDDWPDAVLSKLALDARTAVVTLAHDPKIDDPAIAAALRSDVFYLGCLGSKRTHDKRITRLQDAGFADQDLSRIHGPVGLPIGGRETGEIAISIMAELTQTLRKGV